MTSRTARVGKTSVLLSALDHARVVGCAAADSAKSLARFAVRHLDAIFGIVSAKALRPNDVTRACDPTVAANGGRIRFDRQVPWRRD